MDDLVAWIGGLFDDCLSRAPFGVGWHLDQAEPPVTATVTPADCSTGCIVLSRDDLLGRMSFAARLQAFLDIELDRPVPACPVHRVGLVPVRVSASVHWRCPQGDFSCRVGDYEETLWPPRADEDPGRIGPMLARRFERRHVPDILSFGVERRDGQWVAKIKVPAQADVTALTTAADPISVEIEPVEREAVRSVRIHRSSTETEPAHDALSLVGIAMPLAALRGRLRRADAGDDWDIVVADTAVRLRPDHQIGPPGSAVVLDACGHPFADEGDTVCCVGGFLNTGPVQGQSAVFSAGELRVYT